MSSQYLTRMEEPPVPPYHAAKMAQGLYGALAQFLAPLLMELDARIDKRFARLRMALSRLWQTFPPHWERLAGRSQPVISITLV